MRFLLPLVEHETFLAHGPLFVAVVSFGKSETLGGKLRTKSCGRQTKRRENPCARQHIERVSGDLLRDQTQQDKAEATVLDATAGFRGQREPGNGAQHVLASVPPTIDGVPGRQPRTVGEQTPYGQTLPLWTVYFRKVLSNRCVQIHQRTFDQHKDHRRGRQRFCEGRKVEECVEGHAPLCGLDCRTSHRLVKHCDAVVAHQCNRAWNAMLDDRRRHDFSSKIKWTSDHLLCLPRSARERVVVGGAMIVAYPATHIARRGIE